MDLAADTVNRHTEFPERPPRTVATLLIGRLNGTRHHDRLCRIRNLSAGGMLIQSASGFAPGEQVVVELRCGKPLTGTIAWARDDQAGVRFDTQIDVECLLGSLAGSTGGRSGRVAPRFAAPCPVRVTSLGHSAPAEIEDISQSGVRIRLLSALRLGPTVSIAIPGLGAVQAALRWSRDDVAGLAFLDMIPFAEFDAWLARRQVH